MSTSLCSNASAEAAMDKHPTEVISHVISYLDLCEQLRLSAVSVRWREAVSDCLRRRRRLEMKDLARRRCTDGMLSALLPRLPALRTLHVNGTYLDIDIVSENCGQLEELDLTPFRLDADSVERLCRRCPRLWDLRLPESWYSELLELLLRRLPGVRALSLHRTDVSAAAVALLPAGLERLSLEACGLPGAPRQPADRWPRLTDLTLTLGGGDSPEGLAALVAGCRGLQRLKADCSEADDHLLELLPGLPLQHLDVSFCVELTEDGLVSCLGRLRQLRVLNLCGVHAVTDRVLDSLAAIESLAELTLGVEVYYEGVAFTMGALQRLVVASPSLRSVRLALWEKDQLEALITGLTSQLDPERHVTLAICETAVEELDASVLPSEPSPLRLVNL